MNYNNIEDVMNEKTRITNYKGEYEKALKDIQRSTKYAKKRIKEYWNPIIANYKNIINSYENKICEINNILNEFLTYPKEIIMPFILECINIHEDEKYVLRKIVVSESSHLTVNDLYPTFIHYELIFPENLLEEETKIEQTFYISVLHTAYKNLFEKNDCKYVMMPSKAYNQLITTELSLLTYFQHFPYLNEIGINLINRKLKEPDKKITDILNDELEFQKEEQKKKVKN